MIPQEDVRIKRIGSKYLIVTGIFTNTQKNQPEMRSLFVLTHPYALTHPMHMRTNMRQYIVHNSTYMYLNKNKCVH